MTLVLGIGLIAGMVSALMLGAVVSGFVLAALLSYFSPLPLIFVGLNWGYRVALIGAVGAALALAVVSNVRMALLHMASIGAPSVFLSYLVLLARTSASEALRDDAQKTGATDWYPVGRILFWLAAIGMAIALFGVVSIASFGDGYLATMRLILDQQFPVSGASPFVLPEGETREQILNFVIQAFPASMAVMFVITLGLNVWLGHKLACTWGRCARPQLGIAQLNIPQTAGFVLIISVLGFALLSGMAAVIALMIAAVLALLFAILGLTLLHEAVQGQALRGVILGTVYALLTVLPWVILPFILLGLADTFGDARARIVAWRNQALHPPSSRL